MKIVFNGFDEREMLTEAECEHIKCDTAQDKLIKEIVLISGDDELAEKIKKEYSNSELYTQILEYFREMVTIRLTDFDLIKNNIENGIKLEEAFARRTK